MLAVAQLAAAATADEGAEAGRLVEDLEARLARARAAVRPAPTAGMAADARHAAARAASKPAAAAGAGAGSSRAAARRDTEAVSDDVTLSADGGGAARRHFPIRRSNGEEAKRLSDMEGYVKPFYDTDDPRMVAFFSDMTTSDWGRSLAAAKSHWPPRRLGKLEGWELQMLEAICKAVSNSAKSKWPALFAAMEAKGVANKATGAAAKKPAQHPRRRK
jgi:hypothetical protein